MSYLLFFFVFLASLLTYMFFPRNDRFKIEMNQEDSSIVSFLNQHQAARNYIYQMVSWHEGGNKPHVFTYDNLVRMMPHVTQGIPGKSLDINDIAETYLGSDHAKPEDNSFGSAIVCLNNSGNIVGCPSDRSYVMTYGYVPTWWSSETERRQVWIKSMLKRSHGSAHCGTFEIVPPPDGDYYSIFNGQKFSGFETKKIGGKKYRIIPQKIGDWLDNTMSDKTATGDRIALLLCMSQVIPPYEEDPIFNIDSINNTGVGYVHPDKTVKENPIVPLVGELNGSKIGGITATGNYTIVGVVNIPQYECLYQSCTSWSGNIDFIKNEDSTFSISTSCSGEKCSLTAGTTDANLRINNIIQKRPYIFYYTASASGQTLTVHYPITTTETVAVEGGDPITTYHKSWETTTTLTSDKPGVELKPETTTEAFHIDTHWYKSPLMALRIYNGTLNPNQIRHNLNADRKRFGLHTLEAAPAE